jgi:hypothetical protein
MLAIRCVSDHKVITPVRLRHDNYLPCCVSGFVFSPFFASSGCLYVYKMEFH